MPVQVLGHAIEIPEGYEALAIAIIKCGIPIGAIGLEPEDGQFFVVFGSSEDSETFADLIAACADETLLKQVYPDGNDGLIDGIIHIGVTDTDVDSRTMTTVQLGLPISVRDALAELFEKTSQLVQSDVSYCDSSARRSNGTITHEGEVPKSEWDGHIFSCVPGVETLTPGEMVKLSFHALKPNHITERLWVRVTSVDEDECTGTVDDHPAALTNLHRGDTVHFHKHQILHVAPPRPQSMTSNVALN
jgi:hypothetical protein